MSARITGSRARWSEALAIIEARCAMVSGGVRRRLDRILRARHRDGDSGRARVTDEPRATFFSLTPNRVLEAVEVGGLRCTGRCLPLRAFENRVYEVELEDERRLIRSEEHTSELQSRLHLVCRLLLEI